MYEYMVTAINWTFFPLLCVVVLICSKYRRDVVTYVLLSLLLTPLPVVAFLGYVGELDALESHHYRASGMQTRVRLGVSVLLMVVYVGAFVYFVRCVF